jgi:hypothetical protein
MGSPKKPIDSFVTIPGATQEMQPGNWHAMIDGLEAESFGASDFANGDARVVLRMSDVSNAPDFKLGQVWSNPSEVTKVWLDSDIPQPFEFTPGTLEYLCWTQTSVSLGTPLYVHSVFYPVTDSTNFALPRVERYVTWYPRKWNPGFGFALEQVTGPGPVRVGFAGFMWARANGQTAITGADGMYFPLGTTDTEVYVHIGDGFFNNPPGRAKVGLFMEESAGWGPVRCWKQIVACDEDR